MCLFFEGSCIKVKHSFTVLSNTVKPHQVEQRDVIRLDLLEPVAGELEWWIYAIPASQQSNPQKEFYTDAFDTVGCRKTYGAVSVPV